MVKTSVRMCRLIQPIGSSWGNRCDFVGNLFNNEKFQKLILSNVLHFLPTTVQGFLIHWKEWPL